MPKRTTCLIMEPQSTSALPLRTHNSRSIGSEQPQLRITSILTFRATCHAVHGSRPGVFTLTSSCLRRFATALVITCLSGACGDSPVAPSQDSFAQLDGQWSWAVRIISATGGDCANTLFQHSVNRVYSQTMTLQHNGSSVSGKAPATVYGVNCNFMGSATAAELLLPHQQLRSASKRLAADSTDVLRWRCPKSAPSQRVCQPEEEWQLMDGRLQRNVSRYFRGGTAVRSRSSSRDL